MTTAALAAPAAPRKGTQLRGAGKRSSASEELPRRAKQSASTLTLVRAYVGVTDDRWYRFLADRPEQTEVNFWRPGGAREFRTLSAGELFFFKTHRGRAREIGSDFPYDRVVGGGFFSGFVPLRLSEAWELFGLGNGVASLEQR